MSDINLLPWREVRRQKRKGQFLLTLASTVCAALLLLVAANRCMHSRIEAQGARNGYLSEQIDRLDRDIAEIRRLQARKAALGERMAVISALQGRRFEIVRLFDELARTLPAGAYYNSVRRVDASIALEGVAESNREVSMLMRALEASPWFTSPDLRQVTARPGAPGSSSADADQNVFQLAVSAAAEDLPP